MVETKEKSKTKVEPEHRGSLWTHPYAAFVWLNVVLLFGLLGLGWLALEAGWLPDSGF